MSSYRGGDLPPSYDQSASCGGGDDCKKAPLPPSPAGSTKPTKRFSDRLNQISLSWVPVPASGQIPARAVEGRDSVGIFIARAHHGYHLLPGKAARQHRCCHASHAGAEIRFAQYEVLCDSSIDCFGRVAYDWLPCDGGAAAAPPAGALAGGFTDTGEPLFIARGAVNGERVFGYLAVSQGGGCASFPWGGREHLSSDFEILVLRG